MTKRSCFTLREYLVLTMLASLGIVSKTFIVPIAQIITGPLFIPGGVVAGGFYMMFIVLATAFVPKRGAALFVAAMQGVLVTLVGTFGFHGVVSVLTYSLPGIAVELWFFVSRHRGCCVLCCFMAGLVANLVGTLSVNLLIFRLPFVPLVLSLAVAALFGGLGGLMAHVTVNSLGVTLVLPSYDI